MRARFVRSTLVVVLTSIGVLSVALVWLNQKAIERDYQQRIRVEAQQLAATYEKLHDSTRVQQELDDTVRESRAVQVTDSSGATFSDGVVVPGATWSRTAETPGGWVVRVTQSADIARQAKVFSALLDPRDGYCRCGCRDPRHLAGVAARGGAAGRLGRVGLPAGVR